MKISEEGINFVRSQHPFSAKRYQDREGDMRIGYGTAFKRMKPGTIDRKSAEWLLRSSLASIGQQISHRLLREVSQNEFDKLCAMAYKIGKVDFKILENMEVYA